MAKRRSKEQIKADKIIKANLLKFGEKVLEEAVPFSRRDTGRLQDEMNFRVVQDTTLEFAQMYYGAFNYPAGTEVGEKNALLIKINEMISDNTKVLIKDITDSLLKDFKK